MDQVKVKREPISVQEIHTEIIRKSIHVLIGMTPLLASLNLSFTVALLSAGVLVYAYSEYLRLNGWTVPVITNITRLASRSRDRNKLVLGPITLGVGALMCLLLYPEPAATVGIYALAFGDGLSSIVGKVFGKIRLPFTGGKTFEGSLAAFIAIFLAAYAQKPLFGVALATAATGTVLEALPLEDLDNLVIPVGTAFMFSLIVA